MVGAKDLASTKAVVLLTLGNQRYCKEGIHLNGVADELTYRA